jgi:hypothetical protein
MRRSVLHGWLTGDLPCALVPPLYKDAASRPVEETRGGMVSQQVSGSTQTTACGVLAGDGDRATVGPMPELT